ncbi:hypothetical protein [Sphingomonas trueperi]
MTTTSVFASVIRGGLICNGGYLAFNDQNLPVSFRPSDRRR